MIPLIQLHYQANNPQFKQLCFRQAMSFSVLGRSQCSVLSSSQPVASVTHPFPESVGTVELVEMGHCYPLGIGLDHRLENGEATHKMRRNCRIPVWVGFKRKISI